MKQGSIIKILLGVCCFLAISFGYGFFHLYSMINSQAETKTVEEKVEQQAENIAAQEAFTAKTLKNPGFQIVAEAHATERLLGLDEEEELFAEAEPKQEVKAEPVTKAEEQKEETLAVTAPEETKQETVKEEQEDVLDVTKLSTISVDGQNEDFVVIKKSTLLKLKEERDFLTDKNLLLAKQQIKDKEFYEQSLRDKELEHEKKATIMLNDFNKKLEAANIDKVKMMSFIKKQDAHISELSDNMKVLEQEYALLHQKMSENNKLLSGKRPSVSEVSNIEMTLTKVSEPDSVQKEAEKADKKEEQKVALKTKKEKQKEVKETKNNPLVNYRLIGVSEDFIMLENKKTGKEYSLIVGEKLAGIPLKKINTKNGTVTFSNGHTMSIR